MKDLTLKNGQIAKFLYVDQWYRPVYQLGNGTKVCDLNQDGISDLHVITPVYGEPDFPLDDEFQPI